MISFRFKILQQFIVRHFVVFIKAFAIRDGRSIDIDGMKKIRLPFPSYAEQKKIGDFIDTIDGYSTLHQQKLDQLKKLKAYFLQNLFPAKGEKVPKIRFKGFTGDWEERKIGDCFDERKEGMPNGELLSVVRKMECPCCHETFIVYGNGQRKYCSHTCYVKDRFGGGQDGR